MQTHSERCVCRVPDARSKRVPAGSDGWGLLMAHVEVVAVDASGREIRQPLSEASDVTFEQTSGDDASRSVPTIRTGAS